MYLPLLRLSAGHGSATGTVHDPHSSAPAIHCSQSQYGCCPDGRVAAGGPRGLGCPRVQELPVAPSTDAQQYCTGTR